MKKLICIGAKENLKHNWYFPISAMAFFCLNAMLTPGYFLGLPLAFLAAVWSASRIPSMWAVVKESRRAVVLLSLLTALGICCCGQSSFYADWCASEKIAALNARIPAFLELSRYVSILGAAVSFFFVFFCLLLFWRELLRVFAENDVLSGIGKAEWAIYALLFLVSVIPMLLIFARTNAFYGAAWDYDVIYTSDSACLVKDPVYLQLTHQENDIRQPLFALFAAPFTGIAWLLSMLPGTSAAVRAMLLNVPQIALLFAANFLLTRMLGLSAPGRVSFMLLSVCTYTHLLFVLMMEQYLVVYFWLVLCLWLSVERGKPTRLALWGVCGTLVTGGILLPLMSEASPFKSFRAWFKDMLKYGLEFVALLLAFCRFDIFFDLLARGEFLQQYTGGSTVAANKLWQYAAFVRSCFAAPAAGVNTDFVENISWQLLLPEKLSVAGVVLFALSLLSALWNREKKSSRLAAFWIGFSLLILLGLGWGTQENGLILYSLYFGWAFLVLLWQLAEKIGEKLRIKVLAPALGVGCALGLAVVNIPAVLALVSFAVEHYPV